MVLNSTLKSFCTKMANQVNSSWKMIQQKTFTNWFNDRLRGNLKVGKLRVDDLETDLCDGLLLINLMEQLAKPRKVGRYNKVCNNKLQSIENLGIVLRFIASENIKLVNIGESYCKYRMHLQY